MTNPVDKGRKLYTVCYGDWVSEYGFAPLHKEFYAHTMVLDQQWSQLPYSDGSAMNKALEHLHITGIVKASIMAGNTRNGIHIFQPCGEPKLGL